jgi:hypothetical protein
VSNVLHVEHLGFYCCALSPDTELTRKHKACVLFRAPNIIAGVGGYALSFHFHCFQEQNAKAEQQQKQIYELIKLVQQK